jgi:hypothetical protein
MYCWAWLILVIVFTIAAIRSSWTLFLALLFFDIELILLAAGHMIRNDDMVTAANGVGFIVAVCACQYLSSFIRGVPVNKCVFREDGAGCAGLWSGGMTPFTIPCFPMHKV